jgi:hypothetical protein
MRKEGKIRSSKLFWVTISLVSLYSLSSLLPNNFFLPVRFVFQTITTPFEVVVSGTGFFLRDFGGTIASISTLKRENARLNEEKAEWYAREALLLDRQKENDELRRELSLPLRTKFSTQVATVIARDPALRGKWIFIDAGSFRGMMSGMAVVSAPGVMVGTQIGTTSTLDFGAYDTRRPLPFANPSRHPLPTLYAVCPGNYFTGDLQALFNSRYGGQSGARTVEPLCGSVNQDAAGTAQGDWYPAGIPNLQLEDSGLALVHDNVEPSTGAFSIGNAVPNVTSGVYKFMPAHSGQVNREFSEVTADGNIYCYDSFFFLPGAFSGTLLIQLAGASTLNIQKQSATSCGAGPWTMSSPTSFSR